MRFFRFLVAIWDICNGVVRGCSIALLKGVDHSLPESLYFLKFIALLLSFPVFKCSQFCFEQAYSLNQIPNAPSLRP